MAEQIRNVFISHRHEDDAGLADLKDLLGRHGMTCRDYSITADNPNNARSEQYIKSEILAPRIRQAGCLVVYVSERTRRSEWVEWEIDYARKQGKRIVGVWARGERDCELPPALDRHADAVVGWNGESIIDAINGKSGAWYNQGLRLPGRDGKIPEKVCRCGGHVPIRGSWRASRPAAAIRPVPGGSGTLGTCGSSNVSNETRRG